MMIISYFVKEMMKSWGKRDQKVLSQQTLPTGITEITDIPYINDGNKGHLLDIYYPENTIEKLPLIINIHGGGFLYGCKELNKLHGYHLAKKGNVVFNLNYRLAFNDTKIPGQIQDIVSAINWITNNLASFPVDRKKVFIKGESAGGALTIMVTLTSKSKRLQKIFNTEMMNIDIKAVAVECGLMNIEESTIGYWGMRSMCLDKGYKNQEYYKNLIFENIPEMKDLPPVYLTTNDEDKLKKMTLKFEKTLQKYGVKYKLKHFKKSKTKKLGHIFSIFYPEYEESIELMDDMLSFFNSKI